MIIPVIENNKHYVKFHILTEGKCGCDITAKPEWDIWADISTNELREIRNAIDYFLNHNYQQKVTGEWD